MTDVRTLLAQKIKALLAADAVFDVTVPESKFGDYSTNAVLVAAKTAAKPPMEVAKQFSSKLAAIPEIAEIFSKVEAVKPGFINFRLKPGFLTETLETINKHPEKFGSSDHGKGKTVMVEYFQLNVAKPAHIGHLRSAVIGDSLKRIFISQGYKAVSDTHIGDWGTQFGVLLWAYKNLDGRKLLESYSDPLEGLNRLYVDANTMVSEKKELHEAAKAEFVKLEEGDRENRKLWEFFVSVSKKEFDRMTKRLGLLPFEYELGESFYEGKMKEVVANLEKNNLLKTGETGERYVDLEEYNLGRLIALKSDGATTYELRDLATLAYRYEEFGKKLFLNLYVVDNRQAHDFRQIFKTMELLGYDVSKSKHVAYGFMKLPEGAFSTRKGNVISLEDLISEAESRALKIIEEKNVGLKEKEKVSARVGLGALKYGDLKHNHNGDITFRWEDALSFEGDTGPYLQYTHARLCSILRKHDQKVKYKSSDHDIHEIEFEVLRKLIHFPEILSLALNDFSPNILANYLYELAGLVNNFYHSVPVLGETNDVLKDFRLSVTHGAATVLKNGLYLLGIDAPEEM